MKKTFKILSLLFISFFATLWSCSSDEIETTKDSEVNRMKTNSEQNIYSSGDIDLFQIANEADVNIPNGQTNEILHYEFVTDFVVPSELQLAENYDALVTFVQENQSEISGTINYYSNDDLIKTQEIENGYAYQIECENPHGGHCDDDYPGMGDCSYEGIRQCTRHGLYEEQGTISKIVCAFTFYECVAVIAADCVEENC
ncbi:hypothetical protein [Nonlabens sp. MIC269]|uniref:hypothetical protein n=1 Tax=Nonlabens sp. MIC269 TaxID=1476901 RepID=UPI000B2D738F|nr:hypothetical protein [Nonlabens sp. MIC269]